MTYDELMESVLAAQEQMLKHSIEANSVTLNGRKYGKLVENLPPNIKPTVFGMAVKADYAMPDDCDFLVQYEPPQPRTNADRLRSDTDEELAEWLVLIEQRILTRQPTLERPALYLDWLAWLRQEVDDG